MDQAPILAGGDGFDDDPPPEPREGWLLVRVHVPELNVFKSLQFPSDRLIWDVKQQVLASLPKVSVCVTNWVVTIIIIIIFAVFDIRNMYSRGCFFNIYITNGKLFIIIK